ncbi:MAG: OmcA/MtrC family decaheme c-type cytochrome [Shewanella sp.]
MMSSKFKKSLVLTMMLGGLAACSDGEDGKDGINGENGNNGADGENGLVIATSATSLNLEFLSYGFDVDGVRSAKFKVTNELGLPVVGIPSVRFLSSQLAKLDKGYTERQGLGYITCTNSPDSCLTDHKDGTYTVINSTKIADLDLSAKSYRFDPKAPQRFMVRLQTADGIPGIGKVTDIMPEVDFMMDGSAINLTRSMVSTESCNACHTDIAFARSGYFSGPHYANNVESCATCHTTGEKDSKGTIVERAHRWHNGLPNNLVASSYDCTSCHTTENTEKLPNGGEWLTATANDKACTSCHAVDSLKHGAELPLTCASCHDVGKIHLTKTDAKKAARDAFSINITKANIAPVTSIRDGHTYQTAEITFTVKILDHEGKPLTVTPKDAGFFADMRLTAAWDMQAGYRLATTETQDSGELSRLANHAVNYKFVGNDPITVDTTTGEFTYVLSGDLQADLAKGDTGLIIPTGTDLNTGVLAIEATLKADPLTGKPNAQGTLTERLRSTTAFFTLDGMTKDGRRQVVDNALCASCHGDQAYGYHGRRNDLAQQCVACHNPGNAEWDKTHITKKEAPKDTVLNHISWNTYVHALHANMRDEQKLTEGAKRQFNYPARLNDCAQCHVEDSKKGSSANLLAIEETNALITRKEFKKGADFFATSPAAATCWSCHGAYGGEALKAHMTSNGATFEMKLDETNATFDGGIVVDVNLPRESCSVCHSGAKLAESHKF